MTPTVPVKKTNVIEAFNVSDDATKKHCDLVWAQTEHGVDAPKHYTAFDTMPTSTSELQAFRNGTALKHVMAGKKFWSSLTTAFQVELINHDHIFKRGKDYDGVLLWKCLLKYVCPTTKVSSSNHKDLLDAATLKEFKLSLDSVLQRDILCFIFTSYGSS